MLYQVIPYSTLLRELELLDTRTLEDLIIEGMYAGLFKVPVQTLNSHGENAIDFTQVCMLTCMCSQGKLDQKKQEFQVAPAPASPRSSAPDSCRHRAADPLLPTLQVHDTAGRDCRPGQMEDMIATLQVRRIQLETT